MSKKSELAELVLLNKTKDELVLEYDSRPKTERVQQALDLFGKEELTRLLKLGWRV